MTFDLVEDTSPSEKLVILALACQDCFAYSDDDRQNIVPTITQAMTEPTRRAIWFIKNAIESLETHRVVRVYRYRRRIYYVQLYSDPSPVILARLEALQQEARAQLGFSLAPLEPLRDRMERHKPSVEEVYEDCVLAFNRLYDASMPIDIEIEDHLQTYYRLTKPMAVLQQWMDFYANNRGARRALYYLQVLGLLRKYPVSNPWGEELYTWFIVPGEVDYYQLVVTALGTLSYETYLLNQHRRDAGLEI